MSDERPIPWWYSGGQEPGSGDAGGDADARGDAADHARGGLGDWTALLSGAARMVDWATSTVMAPHAEHTDPREHPQCVVCRTITLVGDPGGLMGAGGGQAASPDVEEPAAPTIQWIPIVDDPARGGTSAR